MSPERITNFGAKEIWDDALGIPKYYTSPLTHYEGYQHKVVDEKGRVGILVGYIEEIVGSPRYELVLWEGSVYPSGIHESRIKPMPDLSPFTDPSCV